MTIHRHIGGLEINNKQSTQQRPIHRHIGGLEMFALTSTRRNAIHRHIGGLENKKSYREDAVAYSPPHRRLRNKGCPYSIDEMAGKMAQMVLYFTLYDLWELYTVQGRLVFSGINMPDKTYSNQMLPYQRLMLNIIKDLAGTVDDDVQKYKSQIK